MFTGITIYDDKIYALDNEIYVWKWTYSDGFQQITHYKADALFNQSSVVNRKVNIKSAAMLVN